jgi:cytoskeletal protein RodZ
MEPLFERYPWLLIPIVIGIVEAWSALKRVARLVWTQKRENSRPEP